MCFPHFLGSSAGGNVGVGWGQRITGQIGVYICLLGLCVGSRSRGINLQVWDLGQAGHAAVGSRSGGPTGVGIYVRENLQVWDLGHGAFAGVISRTGGI